MSGTLTHTEFSFPGQTQVYHGKVRDVYSIGEDLLVMVASDRISAFDVVLPKGIPFKGQVLNQLAYGFMQQTADIVPNWTLAMPDPNVTVGKRCAPYMVEMVIRGYLTGHAWREYREGKRELCGVSLPEGMKEHDRFPAPIITPATKAEKGAHDEDISREQIIARGIVSEAEYAQLETYTHRLFERGTALAAEKGLLLVDTKYEFGKDVEGNITLIDEIHTPDSSRYFYAEGYEKRQERGEQQKQLSKEFVRQWLIENHFQGLEGQKIPEIPDAFVGSVTDRYVELYEKISGKRFEKAAHTDVLARVEANVNRFLSEG
ncbi:MAG: phosphoribosylaminoimidazolesuccinocarboxamide synthase [Salibacteraceae bacterium]